LTTGLFKLECRTGISDSVIDAIQLIRISIYRKNKESEGASPKSKASATAQHLKATQTCHYVTFPKSPERGLRLQSSAKHRISPYPLRRFRLLIICSAAWQDIYAFLCDIMPVLRIFLSSLPLVLLLPSQCRGSQRTHSFVQRLFLLRLQSLDSPLRASA